MKKGIKKIVAASLAIILVTMNVSNIKALESNENQKQNKQQMIEQEKTEGVVERKGQVEAPLQKNGKKSINNEKSARYNITSPSSYRLVSPGQKIGTLYDTYSTRHDLYFNGLFDNDRYWMDLELRQITEDGFYRDDMISIEVYTENSGKLDYRGYTEWDTWGYTDVDVSTMLKQEEFKTEKYLYIIVGISEQNSSYYSDYSLIKITNPCYRDYAGHWAESAIVNFMEKGIITSTDTFRPNDSITRAEFVKILNGVFGLTKSSGKVFEDTKGHWASYDIDVAVTNGVCNGKTETLFKPNDPITREEASVMISNYKKITDRNYDKLSKYNDAYKVSSWAKPGVEGTIEKGYMGGYSDNTFRPKNKITRAEAVATFSRIK